jgi:hypothetical protein
MSNNLLNVIKEVFSTYNYAVSASQQGFDLLAEKPGNRVAIKLVDDVSADDLKQFLDSLNGNNVKILFITMTGFSEDIKKLGKLHDLILWDRPELEKQIGKAVLLGCENASSPFAKTDIDVTAEAQPQAAAPKPVAAVSPANEISSLTQELYSHSPEAARPQPAAKPQPVQEAVESPAVAKARARVEAKVEEEEEKPKAKAKPKDDEVVEAGDEESGASIPLHTVPIKIKDKDAMKIAGSIARAEDVEISLKFIPYWKYDYSLDVQSRYKDLTVPLTGKGSKMINAITKSVEAAPTSKPIENIDLPDAPYNVEQSVVTEEEANQMALKAIIEENTKNLRFKAMQGEAAMVEHKKFMPKPSDIDMQMELLYIPYWAVRSHKGYMEINAYDGKPTKMPMDDGAEIL